MPRSIAVRTWFCAFLRIENNGIIPLIRFAIKLPGTFRYAYPAIATFPIFEQYDHWDIAIRGIPGIDITMNLKEPENVAAKTKSEQYAAAGAVINSMPEVCTAKLSIFISPLFAPFREKFESPVG